MKSTIQRLFLLLALHATAWAQDGYIQTLPEAPSPESNVEQIRFARLPELPALEASQAIFTSDVSTRFIPLPSFDQLPLAPAPLVQLAEALSPESYQSQTKNSGSDTPKAMLKTEGVAAFQKNLEPYQIIKNSNAQLSNELSMNNLEMNKFIGETWKRDSGLSGIESRPDPRYLNYWPTLYSSWESPAFCYKPLYFEQSNIERYGIGYGCPTNALVSGSKFFVDAALLPIHVVKQPPKSCECTLGHRRPGSCAPIQRSVR